MAGPQVMSIQGLDVLEARIRSLGLNVNETEAGALMKGALVIEGAMKEKAAVRTGELRDSINAEVVVDATFSEGGMVTEKAVRVGTNKYYAVFVEYGTGVYAEGGNGRQGGWFYVDEDGEGHWTMGSSPQPFARPAVDENQDRVAAIIRDELEAAIARAIR